MSVFAKIMKARVQLQAMKLSKTGHNKFAGYYYFELGDFLPQIQSIFDSLKLCGIVSYSKDEARLTIRDIEDGSEVVITSPMSEAALKGCHPVQNLGAVETYIRRYLWVTALEIVEHDALDATVGKETGGKGKIKPSDGVDDRVAKERQEHLNKVLSSVIDALVALMPEAAVEALHEITDPDEKVWIWDQLDSAQRRLIKETSEQMKKMGR